MQPDSQRRSNAAWLRLPGSTLMIAPSSEAVLRYEVAVPEDADAGTTYWSMLMLEPGDRSGSDVAGSPGALTLRTVMRYGVQIATHVRGRAEPRVGLRRIRVVAGEGEARHLVFNVVNECESGFRPVVSLELFDTQGVSVATREAQRGLLYPGTSVLQRFDLGGLPPGDYEGQITVDTGGADVFGAQFRLSLPR
jgi:hypothetical protein